MPEIPTIAEAALPGFDASNWMGMFAPGKTPPRIVEFIQREVAVLVKDKEIGARLLTLGFEPTGTTPAEFAKVIQAEITKWKHVIETSGATPE